MEKLLSGPLPPTRSDKPTGDLNMMKKNRDTFKPKEEALHGWMTTTYVLSQGNTVLSRENAYQEAVRIMELMI